MLVAVKKECGSAITEIGLQFMKLSLILAYVQKKISKKNFFEVLTAIKSNSSSRKSINTQSYASIGR